MLSMRKCTPPFLVCSEQKIVPPFMCTVSDSYFNFNQIFGAKLKEIRFTIWSYLNIITNATIHQKVWNFIKNYAFSHWNT